MNKTYTVIIVLVLVVLGAWFFMSAGKSAEAPVVNDDNSSVMPVDNTQTTPPASTDLNVNTSTTVTPPVTTKSAVKEFTVTGQNFSFTPATLSVSKGDTVKITFKDVMGGHNLKIDEFGVATNVLEAGDQQTVTFVADKAGSFQYYCSVGSHRAMGMWGTLTVK